MDDGRVEIAYVIERLTDIIIAKDKLIEAVAFKQELAKVLKGYEENGN